MRSGWWKQSLLCFVGTLWFGCGNPAPQFDIPERADGVRAPLTAACDAMDDTRCLLPFPSNVFAQKDDTTATGIRVHISADSLPSMDDPFALNRADGFSRASPLVTAFVGNVMPIRVAQDGMGPLRLLSAQVGADDYGKPVPLRFVVETAQGEGGRPESFVFAYPLVPLRAAADYVAVVLDDLPVASDTKLTRSGWADVALGLGSPQTEEEAKLAAYHAPTRRLLQRAGIAPNRVLRVWDFTTRSEQDAQKTLRTLRDGVLAKVKSGQISVVIDRVTVSAKAPILATVIGHLDGIPKYIEAIPGSALVVDSQGRPQVIGTRSAPFRVVIPTGSGDYRFIMFGHGTGGTFDDATFDSEIAGSGAAKIGVQFDGWTENDVLQTLAGIVKVAKGSHYATAMLAQALADAAAIQSMLPGQIGDVLSAPMIKGMANPAAGRRPRGDLVVWAGGSLGGILGLVAVCADDSLRYGVLNVPGAAWTHYIPKSILFDMLAPVLDSTYRGLVNAQHVLAVSQGIWDDVDGAAWSSALSGRGAAFLIQESIGDPVVPNAGTEMVAQVTHAKLVGAELVPLGSPIPRASEVVGGSALTQYRVDATGSYDVHGFAGRDTPAGRAARAQIVDFVSSIWQRGTAKITVPSDCPAGSCDFRSSKP